MPADSITLELPTDPRYLDVAVAAVESLAVRAGVDKEELAMLRDRVHDAIGARLSRRGGGRVVLHYDVGDGFLGLRVDDVDVADGAA